MVPSYVKPVHLCFRADLKFGRSWL